MSTTMETVTRETPQEEMSQVQLALVCATLVLSSFTIIINPFTLVAMATHGLIRKSAINLFIASLCLSDFLMGLSAFLFQLQQLLQLGKANDQEIVVIAWAAACPMVVGFIVSNVNAFLIGVDRACATLAPLSYKRIMRIERATLALIASWSTATVLATVSGIVTVQLNGGVQMLTYPHEILPEKFVTYCSSPMLIGCIATNTILYAVIVIAFYKSTKKIHPSSTSELRNRRMTRMITMVIGVLLLGNIPIITVAALPTTLGSKSEYLNSYHMLYDVTFLLMIIPTSFNNCVYVWQLPDFKQALGRLLFCHRNFRVHVEGSAVTSSL